MSVDQCLGFLHHCSPKCAYIINSFILNPYLSNFISPSNFLMRGSCTATLLYYPSLYNCWQTLLAVTSWSSMEDLPSLKYHTIASASWLSQVLTTVFDKDAQHWIFADIQNFLGVTRMIQSPYCCHGYQHPSQNPNVTCFVCLFSSKRKEALLRPTQKTHKEWEMELLFGV